MKRAIFPVFFFLAGCAGPSGSLDALENMNSAGVLVRVVTLDPLERTFELAPSAYDNFLNSKGDLKQAMRLRATAVCAPSGVQILVLDEPEYLKGIDLSPHGYLYCRR
jgi:hypothetical protein